VLHCAKRFVLVSAPQLPTSIKRGLELINDAKALAVKARRDKTPAVEHPEGGATPQADSATGRREVTS
jgi:hypothetical protein